jgi:hypothetical protein
MQAEGRLSTVAAADVPDDLSRLPSLEEDKVRYALQQRFGENKIYTNINALLGAPRPDRASAGRWPRSLVLCLPVGAAPVPTCAGAGAGAGTIL